MKEFYPENTANRPRLDTDVFFSDYGNEYHYEGFVDEAIRYIEEFQLLDPVHWHRFVLQFQENTDKNKGWKGEYWGKMMRGAALTYAYTKNEALYRVLSESVDEMICANDETGRISSYAVESEFRGWDLWCRKYVLLGMQYFLEICRKEEQKERIIASMCRQVDYLLTKIGPVAEKKIPITLASDNWRGLNSSSILEPVVRLYNITKEQKYFDFATYIVNCGGTQIANIFDLAYRDELLPYQYPITKAYEMTSCFEGLLEYYRITGIEKYKTAVLNFARRVLESDFTAIGSSGCTHELFDHSFVRQANTTNGAIQQETCVTVTLMKFFYQMILLTGDATFADAFETSLYNAYFGAINTEKIENTALCKKEAPDCITEALPFDSYSPLTAGKRGTGVGGLQFMPDNHYYGCCACIGSAGNGLIPKMQLLSTRAGLAMNLYINGTVHTQTPANTPLTLITQTRYPTDGTVQIQLQLSAPETFSLQLRIPAWSRETALSINGTSLPITAGYTVLTREWQDGDTLTLTLDMRTEAIRPTPYGSDILMNKIVWNADYVIPNFDREDPVAKHHLALRRGPLMLAQENRLGYSVDDPIEIAVDEDGFVAARAVTQKAPFPAIAEVLIPLADGREMLVTDYASAGKAWNDESRMAVWMLTK